MGVDLLVEAVLEGEYDPDCTRIETALKGIWLLYSWDRWDWLESVGIEREEFLPLFAIFREQYGVGKHLRTDRLTIEFLRYFRRIDPHLAIRLLGAAVTMVGMYLTHRRRLRAAWYGRSMEDYA